MGDRGLEERVEERKARLRQEVWTALTQAGAGRFPGAAGRIPNFVGAEQAAERLRQTDAWRRARTIKANPDAPQWPVRQRALEDGKTVFMAVPRLAGEHPFLLLDPEHLADPPRKASSIKGATRSARRIGVDELEPVDLVVAGSVAAGEDGARLGKGGGFSDLEYAIFSEAGLVGAGTVTATTVHDLQVRSAGVIPAVPHDFRLDLVVTPTRVIEVRRRARRPTGRLRWEELDDEKVAAIPLLRRLVPGR